MTDSDEGVSPSGATLSYGNILEREIQNALKEMRRPRGGLFLSGLSAGLTVSFGALFMGMALTFSGGFESMLTQQVTLASVSSIGFLFVILGQTELFTAHTTMAVLPVLDGRASVVDLARLWAVVYASNLLGCAAFAGLIALVGPPMDIVDARAFGSLARALVPLSWWVILLSGVVAGWLMGLVTWLVAASRDTVSRVLLTVVVTAGIGFGPFHHSLLGTTEVLSALFLGTGVTLAEYAHFLGWTTLGNVVGGSVFVGLLNYGHAAFSGEETDTAAGE
ncbi:MULTISPECIES: formate/nitrite transporter family protein [Halorussus]|uniref:formate/nitrite transporter family protein n=1 Tax=Halorussus TaxID=1070314 RepID=UPI000E20D6D9|nr:MULTISPECIES: formate/nitrite transporter family protein [Halorussus]NHN58463.1 formate/nitrite transporter family protein [Halorussus sp. JP-T4]